MTLGRGRRCGQDPQSLSGLRSGSAWRGGSQDGQSGVGSPPVEATLVASNIVLAALGTRLQVRLSWVTPRPVDEAAWNEGPTRTGIKLFETIAPSGRVCRLPPDMKQPCETDWALRCSSEVER